MKPERPGRLWHDPSKCELSAKWEKRKIPACRGLVMKVGTVKLCLRHRKILAAIVADANQEGRRHPVHHGRAA